MIKKLTVIFSLLLVLGGWGLVREVHSQGPSRRGPVETAAPITITADEIINALQIARWIDGAHYTDLVRKYLVGDPFAQPMVYSTFPQLRSDVALSRDPGEGPPVLAALGSPAYTTPVQIDDDLDGETTMSTLQLTTQGQTLDYSMIGYMKLTTLSPTSKEWRTFVRSTKTGDGFWTSQQMPLLSGGYTRIIDPVLASNPSSSGVQPKRSYFITLQDSGYGPTLIPLAPQALTLQVSDSGGVGVNHWFDPSTLQPNAAKVIVSNGDSGYYLDKPDIVVSQYSATRGFIYLCYVKLQIQPQNPYNSELYVTRSENGGQSWTTPVKVYTGRIQAPQISHSVSFNRLYVSWVNHDTDAIQFAWSDNKGVSWQPATPETAATGPLKTGENRNLDFSTSGVTVPQMRFDHVNNQVIMTWHEAERQVTGTHTGSQNSVTKLVDSTKNFAALGVAVGDYVRNKSNDSYNFVTAIGTTTNPNDTLFLGQWFSWKPVGSREFDFDTGDAYVVKAKKADVYFARKTAGGWQAKVKLAVSTVNDQWQPSIDFTSDTNRLMIGYLDRSADPANRNYEARWILTDAAGAKVTAGGIVNPFSSNPETNSYGGFIGDYTDMWFWPYLVSASDPWGPRWHFAFSGRRPQDNTLGDPWLAAIR